MGKDNQKTDNVPFVKNAANRGIADVHTGTDIKIHALMLVHTHTQTHLHIYV